MGLCSEVADDGENLEDHPRPRDQIRPPQGPVSACKLPGKLVSGGVEPFSFGPDKILPGTLHHSGNRPAPPSDHIPLARRSAFQQGRKRGRRRNSAAPAGLKYLARRFCRAYARRSVFSMESWNFAVPLPFLRRSAGDFHESQRRRIYADEVGNPRGSGSGNFGSATWSGRERSRHGLRLLAMRRVELRIDRELKHAARQLTS